MLLFYLISFTHSGTLEMLNRDEFAKKVNVSARNPLSNKSYNKNDHLSTLLHNC